MQHDDRGRDSNRADDDAPDEWPEDPNDIADPELRAACIDIHRRMLASLVGLPRVRRNRCFGTGQPCLTHHRGLVAARFEEAWQRTGWGPLPK